jgi:CDP-diacylglycerol--serine O-phosphatidyltransferase
VKKIAIIPTLLTLGNAVCGFAAIAYASKIGPGDTSPESDLYFALSGWLIVGAMVFDMLDGYVARMSKSASDFGKELDSLCDAISFGVAPAFLLLRLGPGPAFAPQLHRALAVIAALYMACALLRLARYNIEAPSDPNANKRFKGLPSPGAAGCVASLAIVRGELASRWTAFSPESVRLLVEIWAPLGTLVVALLMVTRIPFPHLTKQILRGRRPFSHLVQVVLVAFVIALLRDLALPLAYWVYAISFPIRYLILRSLNPRVMRARSPGAEDALPH